MYKSMTAFGRAHINAPICELSVEITSLNRKTLEIRFNLPDELSHHEPFGRSFFDKKVERGIIHVKVTIKWNDDQPIEIYPNVALIKKYVKMRENVELELQMKSDPTAVLNWVFAQRGTIVSLENQEKESEIQAALLSGFEEAFKPFRQMKEIEGQAIYQDVLKRLNLIEKSLVDVQKKAPSVVVKYQEKLKKVLLEFDTNPEDRERILKEVALFADKVDIAEEITRFLSHLQQFKTISSGKTIDFLIQEMMREINTIGNKAQDHEISTQVVFIKSELERIREQIQNVE